MGGLWLRFSFKMHDKWGVTRIMDSTEIYGTVSK